MSISLAATDMHQWQFVYPPLPPASHLSQGTVPDTTCRAGPQKLRSLLDGRGQKVRQSSSERLVPKRSKKRAVGLNERYFSSKFHGYDVKRAMAYTKSLLPCL